MTRTGVLDDPLRRRILPLAGQAFALGLMMAWILIPASAIFLARYGSGLLPVTYIGAALAGAASSAGLRAALNELPLPAVASRVLAGLAIALLASWLLLWKTDAVWVSFALLVLVPIVVPVGFMVVIGQAGMLLDVRVLKSSYARVIAGFALGFVVGGAAAPSILTLFGGTEHLIAAAAIATAVFLGLVASTRKRFPAELSQLQQEAHGERTGGSVTLRALLGHRYISLIVAFQMLSAIESQWLDYLVFDRAAQRYHDSGELARFVSRFSAIAYGADIVFLVLVAGVLLRRFGLRYGLTANAAAVLSLLAAVMLAGTLQGSATTVVFVLIVAARVTDLVMSDGSSRTSLGAAYQAVPSRMRLVAQAMVEGLAVPCAIGLSGVVLLVLRATSGTGGLVLPLLTGLVVIAWAIVAVSVYRSYQVNLASNLRQRILDPSELSVDDVTSWAVIDRMIENGEERDVRLGLDTLTVAEHPQLFERLQNLANDERPAVRIDALERLARLDLSKAAAVAHSGLGHADASVRATCLYVIGAGSDSSGLAAIEQHAGDPSPDVRIAVAVAKARVGDDSIRAQLSDDIVRLSSAANSSDRVLAVRMLSELSGDWMDRSVLCSALADPSPEVGAAALAAFRWPDDQLLIADVIAHLDNRRTAGAAVEALVRAGEPVLDFVDDCLRRGSADQRAQEMVIRVCRSVGGASAVAILARHLADSDREVGLSVMKALVALVPGDAATIELDHCGHVGDLAATVVNADLEHAAHVVRALAAVDGDPAATLLGDALLDELRLLRQRVVFAQAIRHGTDAWQRITFQLSQRGSVLGGHALEWLDVTLVGPDRALLVLLEPGLSHGERFGAITRWFPLETNDAPAVVRYVVEDRDGRWHPWLTACALHAAWSMPNHGSWKIAGGPSGRERVGDDSIVCETIDDLQSRQSRRILGSSTA